MPYKPVHRHRVGIKPEIKKIIEDEAKKKGLAKSEYVEQAIRQFSGNDIYPLSFTEKGQGGANINIYLTHTEKDILKQLAKRNGLSASKYIASLIRIDANLFPIDNSEAIKGLRLISKQIRTIGVNLNQQTRRLNRINEDYREKIDVDISLIKEVEAVVLNATEKVVKLMQKFKRF